MPRVIWVARIMRDQPLPLTDNKVMVYPFDDFEIDKYFGEISMAKINMNVISYLLYFLIKAQSYN